MNHRIRKRILLADNLREYRRSVIGFLELEGYLVAEAGTPEDAQELLVKDEFDLVLADLRMRDDTNLNDMSGLAVAKFASECGIPCIIVTAFPTVDLARMALRSRGAEPLAKDLITKASGPQALLDSIRLTLEYRELIAAEYDPKGLHIDLEKRWVLMDGKKIPSPPRQYALLAELWRKEGGVCTYSELYKAVYMEDISETEAVNDTRIKKLVERVKAKIENKASGHEYIRTEFGMGYRLIRKPTQP